MKVNKLKKKKTEKENKAQLDGRAQKPKTKKALPVMKEQRVPLALLEDEGKGACRDFFSHVKSTQRYLKKIDKNQELSIEAFGCIAVYMGISGRGVGAGSGA